jgi:glutamate--cysteine ligase
LSLSYQQVLSALQQIDPTALQFVRGIEKEGLRVNADSQISQVPHPQELGSALTHTHITTDYSEALLEFITPAKNDPKSVLDTLKELHSFTASKIGSERIWPFSMPGIINDELDVPIAYFGESNTGQLKHIYRHGLWHRYGRKMQCIAGLHYNFSVPDSLWQFKADLNGKSVSKNYISGEYFSLIRNFRRYSWLLLYLFGASPALDKSFIEEDGHGLDSLDDDTLYGPYATSLRMSGLGYQNNAQDGLFVCFNGLPSYTQTLKEAMSQSVAKYQDIGVEKDGVYMQLNTNLLQIENEYYSDIRPKRNSKNGEKPLTALNEHGVEYIEVRCLDLNPFTPYGIDEEQIHFMDLFLTYCIVHPSPLLSAEECSEVEQNHKKVVIDGRDPAFELMRHGEPVLLSKWGTELIAQLKPLAEILDGKHQTKDYSSALASMEQRMLDSSLTPSAKILAAMKENGQSFTHFANQQADKINQQYASDINPVRTEFWHNAAKDSLAKQREIEDSDLVRFNQYLADYQMKV